MIVIVKYGTDQQRRFRNKIDGDADADGVQRDDDEIAAKHA